MEYYAPQHAANKYLPLGGQYQNPPPPSTQGYNYGQPVQVSWPHHNPSEHTQAPPSGYNYGQPVQVSWPRHHLSEYTQALTRTRAAPTQRASVACKYCRKRKIRCSVPDNTGKCQNCARMIRDCVFQPVSSSNPMKYFLDTAFSGGVKNESPLYDAHEQSLPQLNGQFHGEIYTSTGEEGGSQISRHCHRSLPSRKEGERFRPPPPRSNGSTSNPTLPQISTYCRPKNSTTGSTSHLIFTEEAKTAQNGSSASSASTYSQGQNASKASDTLANPLSIAFIIN